MQDYEIEKQKVLMEHQEEYRAQKIELETECQNLQQEVERMKAMCMMNVEKLDYSYTVLKRREDENTIIKNQQKRRINKYVSLFNPLTAKPISSWGKRIFYLLCFFSMWISIKNYIIQIHFFIYKQLKKSF